MLLVHRYGSERQRSIDSMWPHVNLGAALKDPVDAPSGGSVARAGEVFAGNADGDVRVLLLDGGWWRFN